MAKLSKKPLITEKKKAEPTENKQVISREKAKADLEKRIAEKLARMSETDLEELFNLHEQQIKTKKNMAKDSVHKHDGLIDGQISFVDVKAPEPEPEFEAAPEPAPEPPFEPVTEPALAPIPKSAEPAAPIPKPAEPTAHTLRKKIAAGFDTFASGELLEICGQSIKTCFRKVAGVRKVFTKILAVWKKPGAKRLSLSPARRAYLRKKARALRYALIRFRRRIAAIERNFSPYASGFIDWIDRRNEKLTIKTVKIFLKSSKRVYLAREWADSNKRKLLAGFISLVVCAIVAVSTVNYFTAYVYAYNGRPLGMVKNQEDVLKVLEVVSEQLTREYGTEIDMEQGQDITFERVFGANKNIDDMQEVFNRLTYMQDMNAKAYALYIDNKQVGILDSEASANKLLVDFKDSYLKQPQNTSTVYERISFAENVQIRQIDTQLGKIQNPDDILAKMKTGAVAQKIHVVEKGETFSGIAKMYGIKMTDLEAENPSITPAKLQIGQEIALNQAVPLLTVQTVEVATYPDVIPYDTVYEDTSKMYKGEQSTKAQGVNGEREITARITRNNGIEIAKEELSSKVIKEPSSAVIVRGTKDPPPKQGTGVLKAPVSGYRISSPFGMRNGKMHTGLDMACPLGTKIGAADGGTVTFAGYKASYGYLIIINHGGNMETYYAHCSKLYVKKGDRVYQGQHIADVGATGHATGPHVHFEVRINGVPKNPLNYL